MTTVFIIKQKPSGHWIVDRDGMLLIKHEKSAAAAISDGRKLVRLIHRQSGASMTVAQQPHDTTILLVRYAKTAPSFQLVAA